MGICLSCKERPAVICQECMRALALIDQPAGFAGIARHPEAGTDCRLCGRGAANLCPECFCLDGEDYRHHLLQDAGFERRSVEELAGDPPGLRLGYG